MPEITLTSVLFIVNLLTSAANVIIAFSLFLILAQILFMASTLDIGGQEFIFLSGILGGIILILAFQKNEPW